MRTGLNRLIPTQWGIRQVCLASGQLYSSAIESLCTLRSQLSGLSLPASSFDHLPTVSAYAEDVYIFIFFIPRLFMKRCHLHGWNGLKVELFWWDSGWIRKCPVCLADSSVGSKGWKYREYFWVLRAFQRRTERALRRECALSCLYGNGCNPNCHIGEEFRMPITWSPHVWLIAQTPPRGLVEDIRKAILDFSWSGQHRAWAAGLQLPVAEGGRDWSTSTLKLPHLDSRLCKDYCTTMAQGISIQIVHCWGELGN